MRALFFFSGLAGDGGVMDGLRTELSAIVERSRIGDRKQQELEQIITRLEDELARHSTQTVQLEERLADKMAQIASLESKLGQRNLKVVDLQNELEEKISENGVLQREVRSIVKSTGYFNHSNTAHDFAQCFLLKGSDC